MSEINDLNVEAPGRNKYPASTVETYVGSDMLDNYVVMNYLEKRSFPNTLLSQLLAWKDSEQAEAEGREDGGAQEMEPSDTAND